MKDKINNNIKIRIEIILLVSILFILLFIQLSSAQTLIERKEFSDIYLENNTYKTYIYPEPINILDNGEYKPFIEITSFNWNEQAESFIFTYNNIQLNIKPIIIDAQNNQYTIQQVKTNYPQISFNYQIEKTKKYKYGIKITNIPIELQGNIKQIEFRLTNLNNINESEIIKENNSIILKDTIKLYFGDIPNYDLSYTIPDKNTIIITNVSNKNSIIIDPTISLTKGNITEDGHIVKTGLPPTYSRSTAGTTISIGASDSQTTYRGYIQFNLSSLPDIADIENVVLNITSSVRGSVSGCDINQIEAENVATISNQNLYNDIGNGTTYVSSSFCTQNSSTDLTANADLHVQDKLSNNLFAVGIKWSSESLPGTLTQIYASESSFDPILIITYNTNLTYDNVGSLTKGLGKYYEYDSFNQLSRVRNKNASGNIIAEYKYDHNGIRIKQVEYNFAGNGHNRTTYYISDNFIQVRITNNTIYNETYYYANGKLLAKKDNSGKKTFYHGDHLGSTTLVTNQSGDIVEEEFYLPFGDVYSGLELSRFLYTAQEFDKLTDLYYYGARYYQASVMRLFTQCDTVKPDIYDPQQLNCYNYARNNPFKYKDSTGHYIETVADVGFIAYDIYSIIQDPHNSANYIALGLDVVGAALPVVTGLGAGFKVAKGIDKVSDVADIAKATEKISEVNKFKQYEKSLKETGEISVKSFGEANKLRESLFPGLQKVPGAGPSMTKASESTFKGTNVYRTDYLFNKETGRIYGHGPTSLHGDNPHINIKEGKNKFTIIIDKIKEGLKSGKK